MTFVSLEEARAGFATAALREAQCTHEERMRLYGPCWIHGIPLRLRFTVDGDYLAMETVCSICCGP